MLDVSHAVHYSGLYFVKKHLVDEKNVSISTIN